MKRMDLRAEGLDALGAAGALAFTGMSFGVQQGVITPYAFLSIVALLGGLMLMGLIRRWDARAFGRASVIAGAVILALGTFALSHDTPLNENVSGRMTVALVSLPVFWVLLAGLRMGMQGLNTAEPTRCPPVRAAVITALYTTACLALSWMKVYPAGSSPDVTQQLAQIRGEMPLNDLHPLAHTLLLKALLCIWDSSAMIILAHILMITLLYGLFAYVLCQRGVRLGWILLAVSIFTACESPASAYVFPWKDTPYAFAVGLLTLCLIRLTEDGARFTVFRAVMIGMALAGTMLLRFNGVVIVLVVGLWLAVWSVRRRCWKPLAATACTVALCVAGVYGYGYGVLGAKSPENGFSIQVFGAGIAAMSNAPEGELSEQERAEIAQYLDPAWMAEHYYPWEARKLIWDYETDDPEGLFDDPEMKMMNNRFVLALGQYKREIVALYFRLMPRHLAVCAREVLYDTYAVWGWERGPQIGYNHVLLAVLLLVAAGASWGRADVRRRGIILAPVFCNAASVAISAITNETRYLLPMHTLFPMLLLYILCTRGKGAKDNAL